MYRSWSPLLASIMVFTGCGLKESPLDIESMDGVAGTSSSEVVKTDQDFYDHHFEMKLAQISDVDFGKSSGQNTLFLNFDGVTLTKGYGAGHSILICSDEVELKPSSLKLSTAEAIVDSVQDALDFAGTDVFVTASEPRGGEYTTIHLAESSEDIGCRQSRSLGTAILDLGNGIQNDIAFAYTHGVRNVKMISFAVLHQAGLTYGLEQVNDPSNYMHGNYSSTAAGFGQVSDSGSRESHNNATQLAENLAPAATKLKLIALQAGSSAPIPGLEQLPGSLKQMPGIDVIASLGAILQTYNPDMKLDISNLLSDIDATIPGGLANITNIGGLQGIEDALAVIITSAQAAAQDQGVSLEEAGVASVLKVFLNPSSLQANDLLNIAGIAAKIGLAASSGDWSSVLMMAAEALLEGGLGDVLGGGSSASGQLAQLPDFSELLSLDSVEDFATLMATLETQATVVQNNYQGRARQSLMSLLKVGYSQAYNGMN
jgi:hypothetical protein